MSECFPPQTNRLCVLLYHDKLYIFFCHINFEKKTERKGNDWYGSEVYSFYNIECNDKWTKIAVFSSL